MKNENELIRIIRTHENFKLGDFPGDMEEPKGQSLTIPGMSIPLQTLLDRYIQGREIPLQDDPYYDGHLNLPDVSRMDKVEKELYSQQLRRQIKEYQNSLAAAANEKEQNYVQSLQQKIQDLEKLANAPATPELPDPQ